MRLRAALCLAVLAVPAAIGPACISPMSFLAKDTGEGGTGGQGGTGGTGGAPFCAPGETRECYAGPEGTKGQGICKAGLETCNAEGTAFGGCDGQKLPKLEDCATPIDDDCDGFAPPCTGVCQWSKAFGDGDIQAGRSVAVDGAGNVFAAGTFKGTIDLDGTIISAEEPALFLAKFTPDGTVLWGKGFPGTGYHQLGNVAVDGAGNVVLSGSFAGTVDFGGGTESSSGPADFFVAKLAGSDGAHLWSKVLDDSSDAAGLPTIALGSDGSVVLFSVFAGTLSFGGGASITSSGVDVLVAKLSGADGAHTWSKNLGDAGNSTGTKYVTTDGAGNVFLTGPFMGTLDFGGASVTSNDAEDIFIAKLAPDGAHLWSRALGGAKGQSTRGISVDGTGGLLVTGVFAGTLDFGNGPLVSNGGGDLFVAKLGVDDGLAVWADNFGDAGAGSASFSVMTTDAAGNVIVAGRFEGTLDFGGGPLATFGKDVFVAKLAPNGEHLWSRRFGDPDNQPNDQGAFSVAADSGGNVILGGTFEGFVNFGCATLASAGQTDAFFARFSP